MEDLPSVMKSLKTSEVGKQDLKVIVEEILKTGSVASLERMAEVEDQHHFLPLAEDEIRIDGTVLVD